MRHPNLFILGAQRAGTTWLSAQMMRHSDIHFSNPKEPLLLGRKRPVSAEDYETYLKTAFETAQTSREQRRYVAEGSANNFQSPLALDRFRIFVPGTPKFIICLRQPVAKGISFFIHNWRRGRYPAGVSFSDTLTPKGQFSPLFSSRYAASIRRWLEAYPRENFLFLKYEDLVADPISYLRKVSNFLDIKPFAAPTEAIVNAGLPLVWEGDVLRTQEPGPDDHPAIAFEELTAMQEMLVSDIQNTQKLTGLDLSDWLTLRRSDLGSMASARTAPGGRK